MGCHTLAIAAHKANLDSETVGVPYYSYSSPSPSSHIHTASAVITYSFYFVIPFSATKCRVSSFFVSLTVSSPR